MLHQIRKDYLKDTIRVLEKLRNVYENARTNKTYPHHLVLPLCTLISCTNLHRTEVASLLRFISAVVDILMADEEYRKLVGLDAHWLMANSYHLSSQPTLLAQCGVYTKEKREIATLSRITLLEVMIDELKSMQKEDKP